MAHPYWPLYDLRVTTPRLEIRLPTEDELYRLLALTDKGIHDPATMPFSLPWTDGEVPRRHRESLQWWWSQRAQWRPEDWSFTGAVFVAGEPVGVQDLMATDFARRRVVSTGSWLGRAHQGKGLGKEMRAAVLHLAFEGLEAREAHTCAFADNGPSLGVTRALGYVENGHTVCCGGASRPTRSASASTGTGGRPASVRTSPSAGWRRAGTCSALHPDLDPAPDPCAWAFRAVGPSRAGSGQARSPA